MRESMACRTERSVLHEASTTPDAATVRSARESGSTGRVLVRTAAYATMAALTATVALVSRPAAAEEARDVGGAFATVEETLAGDEPAEAAPAIAKAGALAAALLSELERLRGDVARLNTERQEALDRLAETEGALVEARATIDTLGNEIAVLRAAREVEQGRLRLAALGGLPSAADLGFAALSPETLAGAATAASAPGKPLMAAPEETVRPDAPRATMAPGRAAPDVVPGVATPAVAPGAPRPSGAASPNAITTAPVETDIVVATLDPAVALTEAVVPRPRTADVAPPVVVDKLRGAAYVQAGIFVLTSYGHRLRDRMEDAGLTAEILPTSFRGRAAIRLRTGPFANREERDSAIATLRDLGVDDALPVAR
ncbi:MAG: SPOR domain-containing protein [Paracoccaceae bacterium]